MDYIINNIIYETINGESSINKLPDFPPKWTSYINVNFYDFFYMNPKLFNIKHKNPGKPYYNMCREMIKQMENRIKFIISYYIDKGTPNKQIERIELEYAVFDTYDINNGDLTVCFSWRIKPKYWPKYLDYMKKHNVPESVLK